MDVLKSLIFFLVIGGSGVAKRVSGGAKKNQTFQKIHEKYRCRLIFHGFFEKFDFFLGLEVFRAFGRFFVRRMKSGMV